jgi:hypothetical protein
MEQCCCPLTVENIPGKHWDFSTYLAQRARTLSGACAELQFLIMEQCCGPLAVEMVTGKQEITAISASNLPRERELSLAHAEW